MTGAYWVGPLLASLFWGAVTLLALAAIFALILRVAPEEDRAAVIATLRRMVGLD